MGYAKMPNSAHSLGQTQKAFVTSMYASERIRQNHLRFTTMTSALNRLMFKQNSPCLFNEQGVKIEITENQFPDNII